MTATAQAAASEAPAGAQPRRRMIADIPELVAEWDYEANGDLTPQRVTAGSGKRVHWVCPKDSRHRWAAAAKKRAAQGTGCPICTGRQVLAGFNDLATTHPDLANEWDPEANGDLTPQRVTAGSNKRVHWACSKDPRHRWATAVSNRTSRGSGCPACSHSRAPAGVSDLATTHPSLVAEWDHEANGNLTPQQVTAGSGKRVHWVCPKDSRHRWATAVSVRALQGTGCPICARRRVFAGFNDLATTHPELAAEWDHEANGNLTPQRVTARYRKRVRWVCVADSCHRWESTPSTRAAGRGGWCPVCFGEALPATHPELSAEWDYEANGGLTPEEVTPGSNKKVHWVCPNDSRHRWQARVNKRAAGQGCSVCAGKVVIAGVNDLATTHPSVASEWDYEANGDLAPEDVTRGSSKKAHWKCSADARHRWTEAPNARTKHCLGCPYCSGHRVLAGFNDIATTHPSVAAEWDRDRNGDLAPRDLSPGSGTPVWWRCETGHSWKASPNSRLETGKGATKTGCPTCSGKRVLAGFNDLATTHPELAAEWDAEANGDLTPSQVSHGSNKRVHWVCAADSRHRWVAVPVGRTSKGSGCPHCPSTVSRGETALADALEFFAPGVELRRSVRGLLGDSRRELDIVFPSAGVAVEFNGLYWHSDAVRPDTAAHLKKSRAASAAGFDLVHVWEDDWRDRRPLVLRAILERLGVFPAAVHAAAAAPAAASDATSAPAASAPASDALAASAPATSTPAATSATSDTADTSADLAAELAPLAVEVAAADCTIGDVDASTAAAFVAEFHLSRRAPTGSVRLGLFAADGGLVAVMVAAARGRRAVVSRYAARCVVAGGREALEAELLARLPGVRSVLADPDDLGVAAASLAVDGWAFSGDVQPRFWFASGASRVEATRRAVHELVGERVPAGVSLEDFAAQRGLARIWDAGGALWERPRVVSPLTAVAVAASTPAAKTTTATTDKRATTATKTKKEPAKVPAKEAA